MSRKTSEVGVKKRSCLSNEGASLDGFSQLSASFSSEADVVLKSTFKRNQRQIFFFDERSAFNEINFLLTFCVKTKSKLGSQGRTATWLSDCMSLLYARYYWSDLSIFTSVDPLAEKYPNMSPYAYCAGNPVKYVDPDGMQWGNKETKQEVKNYKTDIRNSISNTKELIKSGNISEEDGNARLTDLKGALNEIKAMGKSKDVTYKVSKNTEEEQTNTIYKDKDGTIIIQYLGWHHGLRAHEFKHGFQALEGNVTFDENGTVSGTINQEIEAHQRELTIQPKTMDNEHNPKGIAFPGTDYVSTMKEINEEFIKKIVDHKGEMAY